MAITPTEKTNILKLIATMFNLAPSAAIYADIATSYEGAGNSLSVLATNLSASGVFINKYGSLDNAAKAALLLSDLGLTTGTTAGDAASAYFTDRLALGVTIDQIAVEAVTYLTDDTKRNAAFDDLALALTNKATVAQALIDSGIVAATTADLNVIATVTSAQATVTAATAAVDAIVTEAANADANTSQGTGLFFALTAGADVFTTNTTVTANQTTALDDEFRGQLDTLDVIKAGDGLDTITASIADTAATITAKPYLDSVEVINYSVTDGNAADNLVTLDLGDSTGVTTVNLTLAADVTTKLNDITTQTVSIINGGATSVSTVAYTASTLSAATDGGADAKTISLANIDLVSLTVDGIETLTLNASGLAGDIDNLITDSLESLVITGGVNNANSTTETFAIGTASAGAGTAIEFTGLSATELTAGDIGSIDASASTGDLTLVVDDSNSFTATGGAGKLTISNTSAGAVAATATAAVTLIAGAGGLDATVEGGSNTAGSTTGMTLVSITGSDVVDTVNIAGVINSTDISSTATVNESQVTNATVTTGLGNDVITIDAANVNLDAGAGDDTLNVTTWGSVNQYDVIDMGEGSDTVVTSEATLGAAQKATMAMFVNSEVVETTATAEKAIDMTALATVTSAKVSGTHSAAVAAVAADNSAVITYGLAAVSFTSANTNGNLTIGDATVLVGQVGQNNSGTTAGDREGFGGIGLDLNATLDNGSNAVTITLVDDVVITGGAGAADDGTTTAGNGGAAVDANEYETVNIILSANDATGDAVAFTGGAAGATTGVAGAAGADIIVGANGNINITETIAATLANGTAIDATTAMSSINLGDITGTNVTVDASTLTGVVTITSTQGNASVTTGSGKDVISTSNGTDTIDSGAGDDIIDSQTGADQITTGAGNDTLVLNALDSVAVAMKSISDFGLMANSYTAAATTDTAAEVASTNVAGINADILDTTDVAVVADQATATDTGVGADIKDIISNGIMTLSGADAASVDTLAEWIAQAEAAIGNSEVVAFEFSGNTYVLDSAAGGTTDMVIELTGVTGVAGIAQVDSGSTSVIGGADYILMA